MSCSKCDEKFTHNEDTLECNVCASKFHFYCTGVTEANFKKMTKNTKSRFSCVTCQSSDLKTVNDPIAKLDTKMSDIIKSVNFMSNQFDDFNKKLESSLMEMKLLRNENEKIKTENLRLSNEILEIKQKLDSVEQHNLGISVEIKGIPKSPNENCLAIVQQIAKKLNITITTTEATRLSASNNSYPIIIAKLETAEMRKNLIHSSKKIKLNANMLSVNWSTDNKIFINERLTKDKRILFANTRSAAKEKNYKFVWITNSDILIRKDENSKIIRIKSGKDLLSL